MANLKEVQNVKVSSKVANARPYKTARYKNNVEPEAVLVPVEDFKSFMELIIGVLHHSCSLTAQEAVEKTRDYMENHRVGSSFGETFCKLTDKV